MSELYFYLYLALMLLLSFSLLLLLAANKYIKLFNSIKVQLGQPTKDED